MRGRGRAATSTVASTTGGARRNPLLYTAQDVARFCEVDLKTIHHWADAGKIAHHRTEGRHLRFRRNHVLTFLREHDYPVHEEISAARPIILSSSRCLTDEVVKKLGLRFVLHPFESALIAIANVVAAEPDVLVVDVDDPTFPGATAIAA